MKHLSILLLLALSAGQGVVFAQQQPPPQQQPAQQPPPPPPPAAKPQTPQDNATSGLPFGNRFRVDRGGGFHFSKHFAVVFGGIKQGSGMAIGPAVSQEWDNGAFLQLKGVYSIRNFKLVQLRYDTQPFTGRKITASTRVRWQDAPKLSLFHLGPESPNQEARFEESRTDVSGVLRIPLAVKTILLGGTGVEWFETGGGWGDPADQVVNGVPQSPGLGTDPTFVHSFVEIADDTRLSPDFSRTGHLLDAAFHHYYDTDSGAQSFRRYTVAAYQLFPTFSERGAFGVGVRGWFSDTAEGVEVPVFLMATLGGGDYLRGYSSYRFRDRNAALLQTEYRYAVHKMVDVAFLYETGTVAPAAGKLNVNHLEHSVAGGIRLHTKTSGLLRMDLAHGRDGWKIAFGVGIGGS